MEHLTPEEIKQVMARKPNYEIGDKVSDFRGKNGIVTSMRLPSRVGASWKVGVQYDDSSSSQEYYAECFEKRGFVSPGSSYINHRIKD